MAKFQRHIFVCVNQRDPKNPKGCCFSKDGTAVRDELKKQLALRKLRGIVRANNAGCLDHCEHGVAVVVYPEQVWYGGVTKDDVTEIVESHIIGGKVVERLLVPKDQGPQDLVPLVIPAQAPTS